MVSLAVTLFVRSWRLRGTLKVGYFLWRCKLADDVIKQAANAIKERITEIDDERARLERALSSLRGDRRGPGRPRGSSNGSGVGSSAGSKRSGRRRAKRGQREKQLLRSINSNPNYKPADHAREIGIAPNQVYGLVAKMTESGKIRKTESGLLESISGS